jgi:hypothetical protein
MELIATRQLRLTQTVTPRASHALAKSKASESCLVLRCDSSDLLTEDSAILVEFHRQVSVAGTQFIYDVGHVILSVDIL